MVKDWKDCPFGTVLIYNASKECAIKVSDTGRGMTVVYTRANPYMKEMWIGRERGCKEKHLRGFIPRQYLT